MKFFSWYGRKEKHFTNFGAMLLHVLFALLAGISPNHDFHTSWMKFEYNEKKKEFDVSWTTDTEHLQVALSAGKRSVPELVSSDTIPFHVVLYVSDNIKLKLNGKNVSLTHKIDRIEVNVAETTLYFKPIKCRKKLKSVSMTNDLLFQQYPGQKNMVQINYKSKKYSMLFTNSKRNNSIVIE